MTMKQNISSIWRSLIFRSLFFLLVFITVMMCMGAFWFTQTQKESQTQSFIGRNQSEAERLSRAIGQEITYFTGQISLLAKTSAIIALDSVESSSFLRSFDVTSLFMAGEYVSLFDRNHTLVCDNSMIAETSAEKRAFTEFDQVNPYRVYQTSWYWEDHSPKKMFALEIGDRANANGTLSAGFSFRRIWKKFHTYSAGQNVSLVIVSPDNRILMHPDLSYADAGTVLSTELGFPDSKTSASAEGEPLKFTTTDGTQYLAAYAYNFDYQFGIFVMQPQDDVDSNVRIATRRILMLFAFIIPITIIIIILIFIRFAIPLRRFIAHINYISEGHFDVQPFNPTEYSDEIGMLATTFNRLLTLIQSQLKKLGQHKEFLEAEVKKRTQELEIAKNKLDIISRTDALTGLPNRRDLHEKLVLEVYRAERINHNFCFIFLDIDKFKSINDTYGHNCGDTVLQTVATIFKDQLRKYDSVARWGGEEFLALLPETELEGAVAVAERIRETVEQQTVNYGDIEIHVTVTLGVAQYDSKLGLEQSIELADRALYRGKNSGRNQVVAWNAEDISQE